ncbi:hypothetical protein NKR23_g3146 [Pleurostoma richardsiae]|uniref:MARVEL domain-containing protein n=1 Tax=Pleurostoma richardsiae TaxID=41990 RepID=A0AA38RN19_9PEZI|nr:hypothetical protein NKR23_g3146 [Pleurostoma richardsiae]
MRLSSWLTLVRLFQLLSALVSACTNSWLLHYVWDRHLGLSGLMIVLELLICAVLIYTALMLLFQQTSRRSSRAGWLASFIIGDVIFCGVDIGIITVLAYAGLPDNCAGLTRSDFDHGDAPNSPKPGYTTVRFSDESGGQRGELDRFCGMERSFYFVAVVFIFSYIVTILVSVLRILERSYTRNSEIDHMLESQEAVLRLEQKLTEQRSALTPTDSRDEPPATGIVTTATDGVPSRAVPGAPPAIVPFPAPAPASPRSSEAGPSSRRLSFASSTPTAVDSVSLPVLSLPGMSLAEEEAAANLAVVMDGSRYHHHHQRDSSSGSAGPGGGPPPYSPGRLRPMSGHGDEDNEVRLSGYVKGETRAQDLKDAGGF